jgi:spermidine synthase
MRPFETLDSVTTPEGRVLSLHHHDGHYFIHLDGEELMSTWVHGSETALAKLACGEIPSAKGSRILIGGLGLGFTLRAALEALPEDAVVVVAELFPRVVEWNRTRLTDRGRPLDDPRVQIHAGDVLGLLKQRQPIRYQAILLDVDNGPSEWCVESNRGLYDRHGLELIQESLVPGGILGVWSAYPDPTFVKNLKKSGFQARAQTVRGHGRKGPRHTVFLARKPSRG